MRMYLISFVLSCALFISACKEKPREPPGVRAQTTAAEVVNQPTVKRWKQYKRESSTSMYDTIPYKECYILITGSTLTYQRENKNLYNDSIYLDTTYSAKKFNFRDHTADFLGMTANNDSLVLKRDNFDGMVEYFIAVE